VHVDVDRIGVHAQQLGRDAGLLGGLAQRTRRRPVTHPDRTDPDRVLTDLHEALTGHWPSPQVHT